MKMAKQLFIIRHAKSVAGAPKADHERPLNDRGQRDFKLMGQFLSAQNIQIDRVFCSTAVRARATFDGLNISLQIPEDRVVYDELLYLASLSELTTYINNLPNSSKHVAIVGHNPGLTELCNYLTGNDLANLPTCAVSKIEFPIDDWQGVGMGMGQQMALWTPRMLKDFLSSL